MIDWLMDIFLWFFMRLPIGLIMICFGAILCIFIITIPPGLWLMREGLRTIIFEN